MTLLVVLCVCRLRLDVSIASIIRYDISPPHLRGVVIGTSRASRLGSSHVDDRNGVCNAWMLRRKVVARVGGFRVKVSSRKGGHSFEAQHEVAQGGGLKWRPSIGQHCGWKRKREMESTLRRQFRGSPQS